MNTTQPASADATVRPLTTPNSRSDQQRQNAAAYTAYMAQHSGRPQGQTAPAH